jgi:ubiquinone biosynthesis protein
MDWNAIIDEQELAGVLPAAYARFARPVKEGLVAFLEGLPQSLQEQVIEEQLALGPAAGISLRLGRLARCSPVLHKLGQLLARDQRLAPELRGELRRLEWLPPASSAATIGAALEREFGSLDRLGIRLAPRAIAEASVAVVIPFAAPNEYVGATPFHVASSHPNDPGGRTPHASGPDEHGPHFNGVFKLLKPGIEAQLESELALLSRVGERLDQRCEDLAIPPLDYRETFDAAAERLLHEVQLHREQDHLRAAARFYADDHRVLVPSLLEPCSPRVTAMQRVSGVKLDPDAMRSTPERQRMADLVVEALVAHPVFASDADALFHGDPHGGNLFRTTDGKLALLDWSLAGHLNVKQRTALSQIALAAMMQQPQRIALSIEELTIQPVANRELLLQTVQKQLAPIRAGRLPGFSWLVGLLDAVVQDVRLRLPADLILYRKSLHTLSGVAEELSGDPQRSDHVMMLAFLRHFASEWPFRWLRDPRSRNSATRLSNFDLAGASTKIVGNVLRSWVQSWPGRFAL